MECENRKCVNEHRFEQIENDLRELREKNSTDHKEFYNRIESTEKSMVESVSDRKHINEKLDKIDGNVEALMQKPVKRYDSIVTVIITAVISAIFGILGTIMSLLLSGVIPM